MVKKLHMISLGCTKNLVDSEVMLSKLYTYKMTDEPSEADVLIVNTCGFIESAKAESINTILDLHDQRKEDSVLVMAGCLSERYKEELAKELPEIDIFTGSGDYAKIDDLIAKKESRFSDDVFLINEEERVITGSNYHAYIKISEGCNQQCSFCAIPQFKGKLHSRTLDSLVKEVKALVKKGYYDFSFVSQDSSSYLRDMGIKDGLINMIKAIEKIDGVKNARILYLYPSTTSDELIDAIANSEIFQNYFDMPIQHIDDRILKIMKRGSGEEKLKELLHKMKNVPNSFVRTTLIIGHPGETKESFESLKQFMKEFEFDRANVFTYSDEDGTSAYDMTEKVSEEEANDMAEELGETIEEITIKKLNEMVDKTFDVVIDGQSDEHEFLYSARALIWAPDVDGEILVNDSEIENLEFGKQYKATITEIAGDKPIARIIS